MIARAAALAVCCLLFETGASRAPALSAHEKWFTANERAIARVHDARKRRALRSQFLNAQRELAGEPRPLPRPAAGARRVAASILSDRRLFAFGIVQKPPPKTWWERLRDWFSQRWAQAMKALFSRVRLSGQTSVAIGDLLLGLSIVAFLAFLGRLIWTYGPRSSAAEVHVRELGVKEDPAQLFSRARAAALRGDYRSGIALLFSASLVVLNVRGASHEDAAKTIGELRRSVRRTQPHCAAAFGRLADLLTRAIYAGAPTGAADWEAAVAAYEALRAQSGAHAA